MIDQRKRRGPTHKPNNQNPGGLRRLRRTVLPALHTLRRSPAQHNLPDRGGPARRRGRLPVRHARVRGPDGADQVRAGDGPQAGRDQHRGGDDVRLPGAVALRVVQHRRPPGLEVPVLGDAVVPRRGPGVVLLLSRVGVPERGLRTRRAEDLGRVRGPRHARHLGR